MVLEVIALSHYSCSCDAHCILPHSGSEGKVFLQTPFTAIISNITPSKTYSTKLDNLKLKN